MPALRTLAGAQSRAAPPVGQTLRPEAVSIPRWDKMGHKRDTVETENPVRTEI
jgi:hypothetical protein